MVESLLQECWEEGRCSSCGILVDLTEDLKISPARLHEHFDDFKLALKIGADLARLGTSPAIKALK